MVGMLAAAQTTPAIDTRHSPLLHSARVVHDMPLTTATMITCGYCIATAAPDSSTIWRKGAQADVNTCMERGTWYEVA